MKTIYLVIRNDTVTEPIIAFDNEEDAVDFAHLLSETCDRKFKIFYLPYSTEVISLKVPVYDRTENLK